MESDFDIKELWKKQVVPPADRAELLKQIRRFRKNGFKKSVFLHLILLLTIVFMIFYLDLFQSGSAEYQNRNHHRHIADVYRCDVQPKDDFFV